MQTKQLTKAALLAAVAVIIFVIEAQIPPLTPIPGIKMGLSNIVTLFAVYAVRIFLGGFLTGQLMAVSFSLAGGLAALLACLVLRRFIPPEQMWAASAVCAVFHNIGQIVAAIWITGTPEILAYLPVLILSGILAGIFTGLCAQFLYKRLRQLSFF